MNKLNSPIQYAASIRGFFASGVPMYESIRYGGGSPRTAFDTFLVQMRSLLGTTSPFSDSVKKYNVQTEIQEVRLNLINASRLLTSSELEQLRSVLEDASRALYDTYVTLSSSQYRLARLYGHRREDLEFCSRLLSNFAKELVNPA